MSTESLFSRRRGLQIFHDIVEVLGPSDRPSPYASAENWWRVRTETGRVLHVPTRRIPRGLRRG
jgi:hypothetical protein